MVGRCAPQLGSAAILAIAAFFLLSRDVYAQPTPAAAVKVGAHDIGGIVTGPRGPEAGVWVIAETTDLPTKYAKIVVTDDQGRFLVPDLPGARYSVWVRGYGLVDSSKATSTPGQTLALHAMPAPTPAAAADYYPAIYWYSMLQIPDKGLFPGTGPDGNAMPKSLHDQGQWLRSVKTDGCITCHQIGDRATRTIPAALGRFKTSADAWERRIQSGQAGGNMISAIGQFDTARALKLFGDWTDRIAKGDLPQSQPARPQGIERNIVITLWDWASPTSYLHDEISTDRRNPTVNANGLIYGSPEESSDDLPWLDPVHNKTGFLKTVWRDPDTPTSADGPIYAPSPYWGSTPIWNSHTTVHNPMYDAKGRLWFTARIRAAADPAFCRSGSSLPSAKDFPLERSGRQAEMYDPETKKITPIDLCFGTHHLQFDQEDRLWFSSGGPQPGVIGWLDTRAFDRTHDAAASQHWAPFVLDTNGNGRRDAWVEPDAKVDPAKDKRIIAGIYGVAPDPADGSVWGSVLGFPGGIVRFDPKTHLSEYYEVPWRDDRVASSNWGFSPRGMDISSDGVVWASLASGHLASFDRRKCKGRLNGPNATGRQCPEGWTLHQLPGPEFESVKGTPGAGAEASYYSWVDQHNTFGLGTNVPIATANESDALDALVNGKWVVLRVPYPMGYYAKGLDGRIDDPNAGWKGRGLWSTYSTRSAVHIEGGKGQTSKVVHFQLRPNPLAD
jgi:hypothetical protein